MVVLLIAFGVLVVVLIGGVIYRSTLEMHEDDQIFVGGATSNEQSALIARIEKVSRLIKALGVLSGALLVVIAVLWIRQVLKSF